MQIITNIQNNILWKYYVFWKRIKLFRIVMKIIIYLFFLRIFWTVNKVWVQSNLGSICAHPRVHAGACIPGARPRRGIYVWKETGNSSDLFDTLTAVGDSERETGC